METRRCGVWSRVNMIQGFENLAFIPYHDFFFCLIMVLDFCFSLFGCLLCCGFGVHFCGKALGV